MIPAKILIVDDKTSFRFLVKNYLVDAGYETVCADNGASALAALEQDGVDLILSDLVMPEMDGVALLSTVQERFPQLPFVVITAHGSVESAVRAMKQGADDYLIKPLIREELLLTVSRSLEGARLRQRCDQMEGLLNQRFSFENIKSVSPAMGVVLNAARQVATFPGTTISILGESGSGKEVLARAIHAASGCSATSFVPVNCAAIPENLLESELFGHVKGAFTGAETVREGKCARARGGTLFLDEIGDMPLALQAKLLRVLEEKVYEQLGSDSPLTADFRVIVATHRDLKELSREGQFRTDLYYRLNVFPLHIPPLRERKEDIPALVEHFLATFRLHQGKSLPGLSRAALDYLLAHDWPGNVRELRNRLEYATIITNGELIQPHHLRLQPADSPFPSTSTSDFSLHFEFSAEEFSLDAVLESLKTWALQQSGNNKSAAARLLKTTRKFFY
ncbi:MAG: sigma-54 dependent transcriptional regulator [Desulfobulbus sp.]|nr:sigma-54 dependent transcriptional regulator [Desulfobulbus sp.]